MKSNSADMEIRSVHCKRRQSDQYAMISGSDMRRSQHTHGGSPAHLLAYALLNEVPVQANSARVKLNGVWRNSMQPNNLIPTLVKQPRPGRGRHTDLVVRMQHRSPLGAKICWLLPKKQPSEVANFSQGEIAEPLHSHPGRSRSSACIAFFCVPDTPRFCKPLLYSQTAWCRRYIEWATCVSGYVAWEAHP